MKWLIIALIAVALAGVASYAFYNAVYLPQRYQQESTYYYNQQLQMMGYYPQGMMQGMGGMMRGGGMYHMMGYYNGYGVMYESTVPVSEAVSLMKEAPPYAKVFPGNDTIVFTSKDIDLVILSMGHKRAENLTNYTPPPYAHAQDNVFVIYGLVNPTIIVPKGAVVHVTLINLDAGDYHNVAITPVPPPYPYYAMMDIRMEVLGMTPFLPPADYSSGQAYEFSFTVAFYQPGTYYYVCEYPGHAQMGMYGEVIVG